VIIINLLAECKSGLVDGVKVLPPFIRVSMSYVSCNYGAGSEPYLMAGFRIAVLKFHALLSETLPFSCLGLFHSVHAL
jgi:hypothetical protein